VNRELTYNPLVQRTVAALSQGAQPLSRILDDLSGKDLLVRAIVQQTLYALMNGGCVKAEDEGREMVLAVKDRQQVVELLSGGRMDGESRSLSAYVWFRNRRWMENPHFSKDARRLERAVEVPSDDVDLSSEASRKEIERLVVKRPPFGQIFGEVHGKEEQRNELLEKAGLLNVKVKVVGADVEKAEFIEEFWLSQCFVFLGLPGKRKCLVRVIKPVRDERRQELDDRREEFQTAVQKIVDRDATFRERILQPQHSETVEIV